MTLTTFLLARIAEDEAVAQEVAAFSLQEYGVPSPPRYWPIEEVVDSEAGPTGSVAVDPARIIAECEAKRRIVEAEILYGQGEWYEGADFMWALAVRALAVVYADHPDYDEAWRV